MSEATYFAKIENDIVIDVSVTSAEFMAANPDRYSGVWVETFTDDPNKTYAGVGYTYDRANDDFVPPVYIVEPPIEQ
jgi:hypothetical protein